MSVDKNQCAYFKSNNERCKRLIKSNNIYCWQHINIEFKPLEKYDIICKSKSDKDKMTYLIKGGFGKIYKSNDVVLKEFQIRNKFQNITCQNFKELTFLNKYRHPFIPKLSCISKYSNFEHTLSFKLKYSGISLLQVAENESNIKIDDLKIKSIFFYILNLLYNIHSNNIIHGDISLANILIKDVSTPILIDWGGVKFNNIGDNKPILNKYSDPILLINKKIGLFNDIYSLGECIRILYSDLNILYINPLDYIKKIKYNYFYKITDLSFITDLELKDLLSNMLNYDSEKRYTAIQCLEHSYFKEIYDKNKYYKNIPLKNISVQYNTGDIYDYNILKSNIYLELNSIINLRKNILQIYSDLIKNHYTDFEYKLLYTFTVLLFDNYFTNFVIDRADINVICSSILIICNIYTYNNTTLTQNIYEKFYIDFSNNNYFIHILESYNYIIFTDFNTIYNYALDKNININDYHSIGLYQL